MEIHSLLCCVLFCVLRLAAGDAGHARRAEAFVARRLRDRARILPRGIHAQVTFIKREEEEEWREAEGKGGLSIFSHPHPCCCFLFFSLRRFCRSFPSAARMHAHACTCMRMHAHATVGRVSVCRGWVLRCAALRCSDYHGAEEWKGLLKAERSRAVKCPSVANHLAGTKKVR